VEAPAVQAFITKMQTDAAKVIYRLRGPVAEFPNAWIKAKIGLRQFRVRGCEIGMETLWACLTYNTFDDPLPLSLSVTTDYARDTGDPSPHLRRIAEAGFTHVHWCHQWNTDFFIPSLNRPDSRVARRLQLEGSRFARSIGPEKNWASACEYERQAGVELVRNRIEMTARLGADVIIMHIPSGNDSQPLRLSLAELEPYARSLGVRIAIETVETFTPSEESWSNMTRTISDCAMTADTATRNRTVSTIWKR